jgi:hypothetical protein
MTQLDSTSASVKNAPLLVIVNGADKASPFNGSLGVTETKEEKDTYRPIKDEKRAIAPMNPLHATPIFA